ncbi:HAD family hydrolase [Anaerosoma tenue]|uniref:HAD family hydrolase n=1 Tax=Anaerosoma tenue TaxID=2933588 RepID=UPI002260D660|nr:HAD family hydrolase [Anaerosoma tenue]MCK8113995.1 HAD family hydrolase [Anaerosoma tenue]
MRAVLFDLDGTLLDLDLDAFLRRYFVALEDAARPIFASDGERSVFMESLTHSVRAMMDPHPGRTNRDVFFAHMLERSGVDMELHWPVFESFYAEVFPTLVGAACPAKGARRAVSTAIDLGLRVAIATNPIFPRVAIDHRLRWAGVHDLPVQVVTTYEQMLACKPLAEYYRQTCEMLETDPRDCMMVGDDRALDMPASDIGMQTFYVGPHKGVPADFTGDLDDLADLLPRLL